MALNTFVAPPVSAPRILWTAQSGVTALLARARRHREVLVVLAAQFVIYIAMLVAALVWV